MKTTHQRWIDDFIVELRLRDVPGAAIGDAVELVESHLADSGESAEQAFGSPGDYADSLDLKPQNPRVHEGEGKRAGFDRFVLLVAGALLGAFLIVTAIPATLRGQELTLPVFAVFILLASLAAFTIFALNMRYFLATGKPLRLLAFGLALAALFAVGIWLGLNNDGVIRLPAPLALIAGMALQGLYGWSAWRGQPDEDTSIRRPDEIASKEPDTESQQRRYRVFTVFFIPALSITFGFLFLLFPTS